MPEPGTRSDVRTHERMVRIPIAVRTQWECDHWIAEYHGVTVTGETENQAIDRLVGRLELKKWRLNA